MKIITYLLTALTGLSAAVFVAYFMYQRGTGPFTALPHSITEFLMHHSWLQYLALGLIVVSVLANIMVMNTLKQRKSKTRV